MDDHGRLRATKSDESRLNRTVVPGQILTAPTAQGKGGYLRGGMIFKGEAGPPLRTLNYCSMEVINPFHLCQGMFSFEQSSALVRKCLRVSMYEVTINIKMKYLLLLYKPLLNNQKSKQHVQNSVS